MFRFALVSIVAIAIFMGYHAVNEMGRVSVRCTPSSAGPGGDCTLEVRQGLTSTRVSYSASAVRLTQAYDGEGQGYVDIEGLRPHLDRVPAHWDYPAVKRWLREHAALREGTLLEPLDVGFGSDDLEILRSWVPLFLLIAAAILGIVLGKASTDVRATFDGRRGVLRLRYERPLRRPLEVSHPLSDVCVRTGYLEDYRLEVRVGERPWILLAEGSHSTIDALTRRIQEMVKQAQTAPPRAAGSRRDAATI